MNIGQGNLYYNNIWQDNAFVIAKEDNKTLKYLSDKTLLIYVSKIGLVDGTVRIQWCQNLDLAHYFNIPYFENSIDKKIYFESIMKKYNLYGKAHIFNVEGISKIKCKII